MFKEPTTHIEIRDGKPYIAGTGYKAGVIGAMFAEGRASLEWILENYDRLTPSKVHAAAAYYCDNIEEFIGREVESHKLLAEKNVAGAQEAYEDALVRYERAKAGDWWVGQAELEGHD